MAVTSGQSIIRFHTVYDLTPDYKHTRYFSSALLRDGYFDHSSRTDSNYTVYSQYVRVDSGEVKVPFHIKNLHQFTYMSITNSLGTNDTLDHRYYCFIIDMDYVADNCTLVKFKVDVMMTFGMSGILSSTMPNQNFVLRCHNDTDGIGDNLVAEPFDCSDYHESEAYISSTSFLGDFGILIGVISTRQVTLNGHQIQCQPRYYSYGIYTGTMYFYFTRDSVGEAGLSDFFSSLNGFGGHEEEIASIYCIPTFMINQSQIIDGYVLSSGITVNNVYFSHGLDITNGFENYIPNNNKLYTSPYTMLRVTNYAGDKIDLAFELFGEDEHGCKFEIDSSYIGEPAFTIFPCGYNCDGTNPNRDYGISIGDYASGTLSKNALQGYIVKYGLSNMIKLLTGIVTVGLGYRMLNGFSADTQSSSTALATQQQSVLNTYRDYYGYSQPSQGSMGELGAVAGYTLHTSAYNIANLIREKHTSDITFGRTQGTVAQQNGFKAFYFKRLKVRRYLAEQIDNYFTMYGYAQNKLMNVGDYLQNHHRPYYQYIQCQDFTVMNGEIENKYKVELSKIMNNGITFWFGANTVIGNYATQDNTPT